MPKYKIDIWFDQKPEKLNLGFVVIEAENEEDAYKIATGKTEHWVVGEEKAIPFTKGKKVLK